MLTTWPSAGETTKPSPVGISRSGSRKNAAIPSVRSANAIPATCQRNKNASNVSAAADRING